MFWRCSADCYSRDSLPLQPAVWPWGPSVCHLPPEFFFFFLHSQKHFFKFSLIYLSLCLIHGGQTRTGAFFFFFYAGIEKCDKCCQGFRSVALFQSWKPLAEKTVEEHYIYSGGICRVQVQEIKQNWDQTEKKSIKPKRKSCTLRAHTQRAWKCSVSVSWFAHLPYSRPSRVLSFDSVHCGPVHSEL